MNLCSNELWVVQEISPFMIQLEARERRGKLLFVYDFVSRFILHAKFYFLPDKVNYNIDICRVLWKYGIPNNLLLPEDGCKEQVSNVFAGMLGIHCMVRGGNQVRNYMQEQPLDDVNHIGQLDKELEQSLFLLMENKYLDFNEFQNRVERAVASWNYSVHGDAVIYTPAERFQKDVQQHIFLEKQTLSECCVMRCQGMVTKGGTVQVLHRIYQVPEKFAGVVVQFYVSTMQKDEIYIFDESNRRLLYRCPLLKLLE